jgi:hypothetical protein
LPDVSNVFAGKKSIAGNPLFTLHGVVFDIFNGSKSCVGLLISQTGKPARSIASAFCAAFHAITAQPNEDLAEVIPDGAENDAEGYGRFGRQRLGPRLGLHEPIAAGYEAAASSRNKLSVVLLANSLPLTHNSPHGMPIDS